MRLVSDTLRCRVVTVRVTRDHLPTYMWHHKDDPQLFPDSARGALRTTRHGGSSIIGEAARVGVMISRTPRVNGDRDREGGRDVVWRRARDEPGSRVLDPGRVRRGRVWGPGLWRTYLWRTCVSK